MLLNPLIDIGNNGPNIFCEHAASSECCQREKNEYDSRNDSTLEVIPDRSQNSLLQCQLCYC